MTPFTSEEIDWFNIILPTIAHRVAGQQRFRGHVEADDLTQQAWEWLLRNHHKYRRWERENKDDPEQLERLLVATVTNELTYFARRERAHHLGYNPADEFFYDRAMLEELIAAVYDPDAWHNPPKPTDGGRRSKAPSEGNGWVATLADVSAALVRLTHEDRTILYQRFAEKRTVKDIATLEQITQRQVYHRVDRALKRLWDRLGGPRWLEPRDAMVVSSAPRRRAMSNAHAQAVTSNDWNPA